MEILNFPGKFAADFVVNTSLADVCVFAAAVLIIVSGPLMMRFARWLSGLTLKAIGTFVARLFAELGDRVIDALIVATLMVVVFDIPITVALSRILQKLL